MHPFSSLEFHCFLLYIFYRFFISYSFVFFNFYSASHNFHVRVYLLKRANTLTADGTQKRVFSTDGKSSSSLGNKEALTNCKFKISACSHYDISYQKKYTSDKALSLLTLRVRSKE